MENSNNTNCVALTLRKEYKMVVFRNFVVKAKKYTYRIFFSVVVLNLLKLFV